MINVLGPSQLAQFVSAMLQVIIPLSQGIQAIPPGPRDPVMAQAADPHSVVYVEWAPRSKAQAGKVGIEGTLADPETRQFVKTVADLVSQQINKESARNVKEKTALEFSKTLAKLLWKQPFSAYWSLPPELVKRDADPQKVYNAISMVAVLNAGDQADAFEKKLLAVLRLGFGPQIEAGATLNRLALNVATIDKPITMHRDGDYFIVAYGKKALEGWLSRKAKPGQGLASDKSFQQTTKPLLVDRVGTVAFYRTEPMVKFTWVFTSDRPEKMDQLIKAMGLYSYRAMAMASTLSDKGQVSVRTFVEIDKKMPGLFKLYQGPALTADDFAHVPAQSELAMGISFNLAKFYPVLMEALPTLLKDEVPNAAQEINDAIKKFERDTGLSIQDDVLQAFNGKIVFHSSLKQGSFFITDPIIRIGVNDKAKANKVLNKALAGLRKTLKEQNSPESPTGSLRESRFADQKIFYWYHNEFPIPFTPTLCLTDQALWFSLHPQPLKSVLRNKGKVKDSLAEQFAKRQKAMGGELIVFSTADTPLLAQLAYPMLPYINGALSNEAQRNRVDYDAFSFPSSLALLKYMKRNVVAGTRLEEGYLAVDESPATIIIMGSVIGVSVVAIQAIGTRANQTFDFVGEKLPGDDIKPGPGPLRKKDGIKVPERK